MNALEIGEPKDSILTIQHFCIYMNRCRCRCRFSLQCLLKWLLVYNECFALIYNRRHSRDLRIFATDLFTFLA